MLHSRHSHTAKPFIRNLKLSNESCQIFQKVKQKWRRKQQLRIRKTCPSIVQHRRKKRALIPTPFTRSPNNKCTKCLIRWHDETSGYMKTTEQKHNSSKAFLKWKEKNKLHHSLKSLGILASSDLDYAAYIKKSTFNRYINYGTKL